MKSEDHYYYNDLIAHLEKEGLQAQAAQLRKLDADADLAMKLRRAIADEVLKEHRDRLKKHMRPCHQKRIETLTVYSWKYV